jgi:hypothetical protein
VYKHHPYTESKVTQTTQALNREQGNLERSNRALLPSIFLLIIGEAT